MFFLFIFYLYFYTLFEPTFIYELYYYSINKKKYVKILIEYVMLNFKKDIFFCIKKIWNF